MKQRRRKKRKKAGMLGEKTNSSRRLTVLKERIAVCVQWRHQASSHEVIEEYNNNLLLGAQDNAPRKPQYAWNSPHLPRRCSTRCAASCCSPPGPEPRRYATHTQTDRERRVRDITLAIKTAMISSILSLSLSFTRSTSSTPPL